MSVLDRIQISYESLPGEPSFFTNTHKNNTALTVATARSSTPDEHYRASNSKKKFSNFDISTISALTFARVTPHHKDISNHISPLKIHDQNSVDVGTTKHIKQARRNDHRKVQNQASTFESVVKTSRSQPRQSRSLINDFERAALLSYMQTRSSS